MSVESTCLCCGANILCGDVIESLCDNCRVQGHTGAPDCDACLMPIELSTEGSFVTGWNAGVAACIQEIATMEAKEGGEFGAPEWYVSVTDQLRRLKDDAQPATVEQGT